MTAPTQAFQSQAGQPQAGQRAHARSGDWALRLSEFNLHTARFAHRSWYSDSGRAPALGAAIFDEHGNVNSRVESQVSSWLMQELGLHEEEDWQMSEQQKRVWLLDTPSLARLSQELALAMHRDWLVRIIDGARIRILQAKIGNSALRFVVEEVPQGSFHYSAPVASFETDTSQELTDRLRQAGARSLMALLQPAWRAVRGRAALHFERSWGLDAVPPFDAEQCRRALELICGRLIPRRFPEWAWLF
jgi:hypothetical protein